MRRLERFSTIRGIVEQQVGTNHQVVFDKFRMEFFSRIHQLEEAAHLKERRDVTIFEPQPDQP